MSAIKILSVNISEKKGVIKKPVTSINLSEIGVNGDAHSGSWHRQISLLAKESIHKFELQAEREIKHGEFAENITSEGFELHTCNPLDRFKNDTIELEVTQIGKKCHGDNCAIFREVGNCVMPKEGIFARTIKGGKLEPGDVLEYLPKTTKIHIITLSDRASKGEYKDKSGPHIQHLATKYLEGKNYPLQFSYDLIPDSPEELKNIINSKANIVDIIFTTGGTGIGSKDFTPDVVKPILDKEIPGIMEMVRLKYGAEKPNALLSRSIAGTKENTLIYVLPGSVKAVSEYLEVILPTIRHSILMLHDLGH